LSLRPTPLLASMLRLQIRALESTRHFGHLHLQREFGRSVGRGSIRVFIEASDLPSRAEGLAYQDAGTADSYSHFPVHHHYHVYLLATRVLVIVMPVYWC
jgi:hypothetical protein